MTTESFIAGLPDPDIIETLDFEAVVSAMRDELVALYPAITGVVDIESSPARLLIEVFAYREILVRARVNDATRANLVAYSTGTDLDHLAAFHDVERLEGETDAALRTRVILAIAGRSPGGTEERYAFIARSADVRVADCVVYRDEASPIVRIAVTATDNGGVADAAMLEAVTEAVNDPAARIVSDTIEVEAAASVAVDIAADIWLDPDTDSAVFDGLEDRLTAAWAAYGGIGRDLTVSWITKTLMAPGVQRVDVTSPASHVDVPFNRAAAIGTVALTNRGRAY